MSASRLFAIDEQIQLNAMYLLALLYESGSNSPLQDLILSFFLIKHSSLLNKLWSIRSTKKAERVTGNSAFYYPSPVGETFKSAVHYLMRFGLVSAHLVDGSLVYTARHSSITITIPQTVSNRAKIVTHLLGSMGRDELKHLIQEGVSIE